jgi:gliding motility-associated-like protein
MVLGGENCWGQQWLWGRQGAWYAQTVFEGGPAAVDKYGNVYMASSGGDSIRFGADTISEKNHLGSVLVKYDSNGAQIWSTQSLQKTLGWSVPSAITTDSNNNVYLTGVFKDTVAFGSYQLIYNNESDNPSMFIVKYTASGSIAWVKQPLTASGSSYAGCSAMVTDASGNLYTAGEFYDTVSFGANVLISNGTLSEFLVKYDLAGNVIWAVQSNAVSNPKYCSAAANSLTSDVSGNIYVTGYFSDSVSFGPHILVSRMQGSSFLIKFDAGGNVLWAEQSNSSHYHGHSEANSVVTDRAGNIYINGEFNDTVNFGSDVLMANMNIYDDETFITKYSPYGNVIWAKQSVNADVFNGISMLVADTDNHLYLEFLAFDSNYTFGGNSFHVPVSGPAWPRMGVVCISKLDTTGNVVCSSLYPNPNNFYNYYSSGPGSYPVSIAITCNETGKNVYVAGTNFYDTLVFNTDSLKAGWRQDFPFLARWQPCADIVNTGTNSQPAESANCLFVPNAFSPNQSVNNILYVHGPCIASIDFNVFDRWGNKVFKSQNLNSGWDGTYKGQPLNVGTYIWYVKATLFDGTSIQKHGNVALVR